MVKTVTQKRKKGVSVKKRTLFNIKTVLIVTTPNIASFYGEDFLAPRLTPRLEYHPFWVVRDFFLHKSSRNGIGRHELGLSWLR